MAERIYTPGQRVTLPSLGEVIVVRKARTPAGKPGYLVEEKDSGRHIVIQRDTSGIERTVEGFTVQDKTRGEAFLDAFYNVYPHEFSIAYNVILRSTNETPKTLDLVDYLKREYPPLVDRAIAKMMEA